MKLFYTLFATFIFLSLNAQDYTLDTFTVNEALKSNRVKLEIKGYYGESEIKSIDGSGFYYGKCITTKFKNISDSGFVIKMPVGSILKCRDTNTQDMIVTKSFSIPIFPSYTERYLIYAMCGEISDAGPTERSLYDYGGMAEPNVVKVAKLIEENRLQEGVGQYAMWSIRNDAGVMKLTSYGATQENLQYIVDLFDEAGLSTKLTKEIPPTIEEVEEVEEIEPIIEKVEPKDEFEINTLTWILIGLSGFLLVTIVVIIIVKRGKSNTV